MSQNRLNGNNLPSRLYDQSLNSHIHLFCFYQFMLSKTIQQCEESYFRELEIYKIPNPRFVSSTLLYRTSTTVFVTADCCYVKDKPATIIVTVNISQLLCTSLLYNTG
ncbi:hypothetical protein ILYODFUR_012158 [Ilyodon furcidens]|uniref:Uncharacterized protein n=1 Tax=Ilyodon furcidens TaxID=33524 RepID=A0ABV0TJ64_9TELE